MISAFLKLYLGSDFRYVKSLKKELIFVDKRKLLVSSSMGLILFLLLIDASLAEKRESNDFWESQEKPGAEAQEFKSKVMKFKDKRDTELALLIQQRDIKIQALSDDLKKVTQSDVAKIKKDQQTIQERKLKGEDLSKAQTILFKEEQSVMQKFLEMQKQVNDVKAIYDQEIRNLIQAYAQQFAILQQMSHEK